MIITNHRHFASKNIVVLKQPILLFKLYNNIYTKGNNYLYLQIKLL